MEVAGAHHLVAEDHRVIDNTGQFMVDGLAAEGDHVTRGAVHLWRAAQRVRVLHGVA